MHDIIISILVHINLDSIYYTKLLLFLAYKNDNNLT